MSTIHIAIVSRQHGSVSPRTCLNMIQLARAQNIDIEVSNWSADVYRARSRVATVFLLERAADYLLFWDDDVSFDDPVRPLQQMLSAAHRGHDFIVTVYPKKTDDESWPFIRLHGERPHDDGPHAGLMQIAYAPMGCTMLSRACVQRVWDAHPELEFVDVCSGVERRCRALFYPVLRRGEMLSEDFAFSERWRELGGKIWLNMGSIADHYGAKLYSAR
jgi:hypothetical protein